MVVTFQASLPVAKLTGRKLKGEKAYYSSHNKMDIPCNGPRAAIDRSNSPFPLLT